MLNYALTKVQPPAVLPSFAGARRRLRTWRREATLAAAILVVAAAVLTAGAGFIAHNHQVEHHRAALTEAFLRLYAQPPVSDSWVRLSRVWRAHQPELAPLLDRVNGASTEALPWRALEWDYAVNRIIEEEGLEGDIDVVFRFY